MSKLFSNFIKLNKHYKLSYLINKTGFFKRKYNPFYYEIYEDAFNVETNIPKIYYFTPKKKDIKNKNIIISADIETAYMSQSNIEGEGYDFKKIYEILLTPNYSEEEIKQSKINNISQNHENLEKEKQNLQINNTFLFSLNNLCEKIEQNIKFEESKNQQKMIDFYNTLDKEIKINKEKEFEIKLNEKYKDQDDPDLLDEDQIRILQKNFFEKRFKNLLFPIAASFFTKTNENEILSQTFSLPQNIFNNEKNPSITRIIQESKIMMQEFLIEIISLAEDLLKKSHPTNSLFYGQDCVVIYMHNLSAFDGFFVLQTLLKSRILNYTFKLNETLKVSSFGGLIYRIKIGNLIFQDSYRFVPMSLNKLSFLLLNKQKKEFDLDNFNIEKLQEIFQNNNKFDKLIEYCLYDSLLLYESMILIQNTFWKEFNVDITLKSTISNTAVNLFLSRYYNFPYQYYWSTSLKKDGLSAKLTYDNKLITVSTHHHAIFYTKPFLEQQLRNAYYGGRTELFQPESKNGFVFDVNSLYPFVLMNDMPYGSPIYDDKYRNWTIEEFESFFGFFKIYFVTPPNYALLPVLPRRYPPPINHNVYSLGIGEGWYFSEEIKLARQMGYKIKIIESIKFYPHKGFSNFITDFFNLRQKYPKGHPINLVTKGILNSTYGRFGISLTNHTQMKTFNYKKTKEKKNTKTSITSMQNFLAFGPEPKLATQTSNTKIHKNYEFKIKQQNTKMIQHSKEAQEFLKQENDKISRHPLFIYKNTLSAVQISAAVSSYARIYMYRLLSPLFEKEILFYTDTDSIFTNEEGMDYLKSKNMLSEHDLGLLKKETNYSKANIIGLKVYGIEYEKNQTSENNYKIAFKGLSIDKMNITKKQMFNKMEQAILNEGEFAHVAQSYERLKKNIQNISIESYTTSQYDYSNKEFISYRKRIIKNKKWIKTQTLILNEDFQEISLNKLKKALRKTIFNVFLFKGFVFIMFFLFVLE
jgi:hypothetical protein